MAKEEQKQQQIKEKWKLGQIATQTADVIVNAEDPQEQLTIELALVRVLNNQEKLMRLLD